MGNGVSHFTNWVQLQCNSFTMTSGTLNIGVGTTAMSSIGDTLVVQGNASINANQGNNATLAVYAMQAPNCTSANTEWTFLTVTNNGTLTGSFGTVAAFTGGWAPPAAEANVGPKRYACHRLLAGRILAH